MKRILVLFFTLLAVFSARGQKTVGQLYYLSAEADVDGAIAACRPITGKATDMSSREQRSYVFSGLAALKRWYSVFIHAGVHINF